MGRRAAQQLTAKAVEKKSTPGYYADGNGLYLRVKASGAKSWAFCYMLAGKSREMGLARIIHEAECTKASQTGTYVPATERNEPTRRPLRERRYHTTACLVS